MAKKLNCWETLKCNQAECPAYGIKDHKCWLTSGTLCYGSIQGEYINKIGLCLNCKVFNGNFTISSAKRTLQLLSRQLEEYSSNIIEHKNKFESLNKELANAIEDAKLAAQILRDIIDFLPDPTFVIDGEKKVIEWNKAMEELTGVKKTEVIGKGDYAYAVPFYGYKRPILIDLLNIADKEIERQYGMIQRNFNSIFGEVYIPSFKEGKGVYLWAIASPIFDKDGCQVGAIESIRDITAYKDNEKMLADINEKLSQWADELEQRTRELSMLNETSEQIQSIAIMEEAYNIISKTMQRLFPSFCGCLYMLNNSMNLMDNVANWGGGIIIEKTFNPSRCIALREKRIHISDASKGGSRCKHLLKEFSGNYICIPLISQDVLIGLIHLRIEKEQSASSDLEMTEPRQLFITTIAEHISLALYNIKLRETLRYQAIRDPLTDLFNRRYMEENLELELRRASRHNLPIGFIMFDIDFFKRFNDTFGHAAGDTMLRQIALFTKSRIRAEDIASRYGGEEFLITMPGASLEITRKRAEILRQEVKKLKVEHNRQPLGPITMSFGVSAFPTHGQSKEALIKAADKALYEAKAGGRDKVVVAE